MQLYALRSDTSADEDALTFPCLLLDADEGKPQNFFTSLVGLPVFVSVGKYVKKYIIPVLQDLRNKYPDEICLSERAVMTVRNVNLDALSDFVADMIQARVMQYVSANSIYKP